MPDKPQPLKPLDPPPPRPDDIPPEVWSFPQNLAEEANARGLSQANVAEIAGVNQGTVSRWMHYKMLATLRVAAVARLEYAMKLHHGDLTLTTTELRRQRYESETSTSPAAQSRAIAMALKILREAGGDPAVAPDTDKLRR